MKQKKVFLVGMVVMCLGLVGTPASWANSLTFQDVTFNLNINGSGDLELNITNALNASGDWTGINALGAFALNNFGSATGLTATDNTGQGITWTTMAGGLDAGGCNGSGASWTCFDANPDLTLSNDFTITMDQTTGTFDLSAPPHLKIWFQGADQGDGHGNLLSSAVPVPGTFLMFGLGMVAFVGWQHRTKRELPGLAA